MNPCISPKTKVPTPQSEKGLFREEVICKEIIPRIVEEQRKERADRYKGGLLGGISPKQPLVFFPIAIIALPLTLTLTDLLALSSDSSSNTAPIIRVISADPIADDLIFHFTIQLQSSPFIHHIFLSAMAQNNQVIDLPAEFYQQINTASLEELINLVFHQDAHSSWRNISDLINVVEFFNCIADHQDYRMVTIEPTDIPFNEHHWFQLHPWTAPGWDIENQSNHSNDADIESNGLLSPFNSPFPSTPDSLPELIPITPPPASPSAFTTSSSGWSSGWNSDIDYAALEQR
ncbi:hypothetical protein BOTBODRAFT_174175 [Botryobasidium botryosum FD-172 SS1]|uniref:Uncharacterized protein n=1 Tax=Botryobasidium botryosum (strain FD-172 SS1) TaxID=930990 RepID=A0A067MSY7_BOTB1|nr:hypothetical protein BOTBODRAFT_174175 [Botryobasidium botryosum FD-172 SS1]